MLGVMDKNGTSDESEAYEEEEVTHELWHKWTKSFRQQSLSHSELDDELLMPVIKKQRLGLYSNNDDEQSIHKTSGMYLLYVNFIHYFCDEDVWNC